MSSTHTIAWQNLTLTLPTSWNLHRHEGNHHRGALLFRDLRTTRLELRWLPRSKNTPPDRILQKRLAPLKKKSPSLRTETLSDTSLFLHHKIGTFLLALTPTHLTELFFPKRAPADDLTPITTAFLDSISAPPSDTHLWSVYGATGHIPTAARLKHTSLLPGSTTLTFAHEKSTITLGALSLADRLLQDLSLQEWATAAFPLIARLKDGTWTNSPHPLTFSATCRRLLKTRRHTLTLTHDETTNQIRWTHHVSPIPS